MSDEQRNPVPNALQPLSEHSPADAHRLAVETMDRPRTVSMGRPGRRPLRGG
ncbi:hypothetical protein GCM10008959_23700 [Deinococcus seoulensis]|uniref:Uncharacterized protein n=1 Tax=Deinococcus seoulensis TaxID=1837379 RepID=A0ABQ2RTW0_9DEIO|nr:hypothetical protein GCM10008959_23700 [Deinococcus seoulensis]